MYDKKAAYFDAQATAPWANYEYDPEESAKLERLFSYTGPLTGMNVLEPGCGAGRLTMILSDRVGPEGRVTALDISPAMIRAAEKRTRYRANARVYWDAIESFPLPGKAYDLILCHQVFPHFADKAKALRIMKPALKPDGKLILFHFINFAQINDHHRKAGTAVENDLMPEEAHMRRLFNDAGFDVTFIIDDEQGYFLSARLSQQQGDSMDNNGTPIPDLELKIKPVGVVRSEIKTPRLTADKKGLTLEGGLEASMKEIKHIRSLVSELVIDPDLDGILEGIEDFSHILVLYWPHLLPPEGRSRRQVHPMGLPDFPLVGIFCTCSPARPNPILVTAVRLLERKGNILKVQGFEAVDGSPIIDIKPYSKSYLQRDSIQVSDWMQKINDALEGIDE